MKKMIKYFSVILFCSFFMFLLVNKPVEANYDPSKNTVNVSVNENEVKITVRYQRGISTKSYYLWCARENINSTECKSGEEMVSGTQKINFIQIGGDNSFDYFSKSDAPIADSEISTYTFTVPKEQDSFLKDKMYKSNEFYSIKVVYSFCAVRTEGYNGCQYADKDNSVTFLHVNSNDLINHKTIGGSGSSTDEIEDDGLKTMMEQIYEIVHGTVMPIIWGVLGLFLVVKGSVLGIQIVKSADEPQLRQEKIGSLKWLVIGVAIAYASSFLVDVVIGFFSNAFN